jgi:F0F1-type ATP synthase membrane subunit c/vacuolar-type H+-ATPase subunit K
MSVDSVRQIKSELRKMRLIHAAFAVSMPLVIWITQSISGYGCSDWTLWYWVMAGLALWAVFGGFQVRGRAIRRSEEALVRDTSNLKALRQWQAGQIIGMAFAEAIVFYGVVVRMVLRGTVWQALPFYAVGLLLLLFWTPRMPQAFARS